MPKNPKLKLSFEIDAEAAKALKKRAADEDLEVSKLLRRAVRMLLDSPRAEPRGV